MDCQLGQALENNNNFADWQTLKTYLECLSGTRRQMQKDCFRWANLHRDGLLTSSTNGVLPQCVINIWFIKGLRNVIFDVLKKWCTLLHKCGMTKRCCMSVWVNGWIWHVVLKQFELSAWLERRYTSTVHCVNRSCITTPSTGKIEKFRNGENKDDSDIQSSHFRAILLGGSSRFPPHLLQCDRQRRIKSSGLLLKEM